MVSCSPTLDVVCTFSCRHCVGLSRSISTLLFSIPTLIQKIMGLVVFCVFFINLFVILVHPSFRHKEISLLDDPSISYTSGESVGRLGGDEL